MIRTLTALTIGLALMVAAMWIAVNPMVIMGFDGILVAAALGLAGLVVIGTFALNSEETYYYEDEEI